MARNKRSIANARAQVLRPLYLKQVSGKLNALEIEVAAKQLNLSKSTVWRLLVLLKNNDGRLSALLPKRSGPKQSYVRIAPEVDDLIKRVLRERYLVKEPPSFRRIVGEIRKECVVRGFVKPARETIKSRLDAMDARKVLSRRAGAKAAAQKFSQRPGSLDVQRPLDIVQIDHTTADITLVDHVERKSLTRPHLTLAIDVATRVILGAYVSFDPPSILSVALCLDHCMRQKTVQMPGTMESLHWPTSGIPAQVNVDNAQEFHSTAFRLACEEWGINVEYRPKGGAHYGGHVERLIGTTMGAVHTLPGTTRSSPQDKGEYDNEKHASLTLSEFEDWLHLEICRYHNTRHSALGRSPLAAWADMGGDDVGRRIVDTEGFKISFMPFEFRKLGRTGIILFSVKYWSDAFGPLVGRLDHKVMVKYDPRDLSQIWMVVDNDRVIAARYKDLSRPSISLWESRRARKECLAKGRGRVSEAMLFQVISEQRRIVDAARQKTKAARVDAERDLRRDDKSPLPRDPSREMFAIDTSNPNLPTFPIDDFTE